MEEKEHKKRSAQGDAFHKKNWREVNATLEEIKAFLSDHIYLRYNTVKHQVEYRLPPDDPFSQNSELAHFVKPDWAPMSDRLRNTLHTAICQVKPEQKSDLQTVLDSGFVPPFHPFLFYLNRLPPWDGLDYILELSAHEDERGEFYTATEILQAIGSNLAVKFRVEHIGSAMKALGYIQYKSHGRRGYRVVAYKHEEIEMNRRQLAYDAQPESETYASDNEKGDRGDTPL